ncbi:hypothetical protein INT44_005120, partial [Umbelopsis vinacea]
MLSSQLLNRLKRELAILEHEPPPGIVCYPMDDDCTHLEAHINGPADSPFEKGTFKLDIQIPQRYPFDPPQMRFITPIYHPNIDEAGRICADILKMPPAGNWVPALNLSTVLLALSGLMSEPNPEDPLEMDIAAEYKENIALFRQKAQQMTLKYAIKGLNSTPGSSSSQKPILQAADAESSRIPHTATPSLPHLISQDTILEPTILPIHRSKKMGKLSLSKRKTEDNRVPTSERDPKETKGSTVNTKNQMSTPTTSKYFNNPSKAAATTPSSSHEVVNTPLNSDGETLQPVTTNSTIPNNNQSDNQATAFELDEVHQVPKLSSQRDSDECSPKTHHIAPRNEIVQDINTLNHIHPEALNHSSDDVGNAGNLYTTHSPNPICTTPQPPPTANPNVPAIKDDTNNA